MAGKRFTVDAVFRGINKISKPVRSMGRSISKFVRNSNKKIDKLGQNFKKFGSIMAKSVKSGVVLASAAMAGLGAAVFGVVKQFSKLEDAEAAFTPLLGSAKKATELVNELNKTAASTPFQFENLAGAANQLLPVMNGNIEKTIKTLRMLGDTSGGNAQKLESITRGFTKAMLKGKVDMESLNMIAEAGVPIFGDLAKVMGTKVGAQFFKDISAGKVSTDQLTKAFENMTNKGGIFFKGMEVASKTTTGVISTMTDNISLAAASIGKILAPTVKEYAGRVTELAKNIKAWVQENEGLIKSRVDLFLKTIISTTEKVIIVVKQLIPVFKTMAEIGKKAFEFISFMSPFLKPFIGTLLIFKGALIAIAIITKGWAAAQAIVNAVMLANPVTLVAIAIAALIASIVVLIDNWDLVVSAFKSGVGQIWGFLSGLLGNPFIAAIGTVFLPFITIPALIIKHWEPVKTFFSDLFKNIKSIPGIDAAFKFLGIGGDGGNRTESPRPVTADERLSRTINENTDRSIEQTENSSVLTIKDQTGRAELSPQKKGGAHITLATSGAV